VSELLSPKQVARAIGVSESSLKRWCDRGLLPTLATPGGHRKLPISGVLEFIRQSKHTLIHPDAIGLPVGTGRKCSLATAKRPLVEALINGDDETTRQIVINLYLDDVRISRISDELLAPAFHEVGSLWQCGDIEVYRERRACRICVRVLHELRALLSPPRASGPVALGGTPEGDIYEVPTTMIELVLRQSGWQASSLGSSLPFSTLAAAIRENRPRLFWLSVSHIADEAQFLREYDELYEVAGDRTALVVGGRALVEPLRKQMRYAAFCDNLQHLEAFVRTLTLAGGESTSEAAGESTAGPAEETPPEPSGAL
jgi:MerR family transcriptional regulator, light-induced transcriptional regulator